MFSKERKWHQSFIFDKALEDNIKDLSRSGNHIYSPLFVGLKKKGAITAIPLAPMAAACLAYKRENGKYLKVHLLYIYYTYSEKESYIHTSSWDSGRLNAPT